MCACAVVFALFGHRSTCHTSASQALGQHTVALGPHSVKESYNRREVETNTQGTYDVLSNEGARNDLVSKIIAIPIMPTLPQNQTDLLIMRMRHVIGELNFLDIPAHFITGTTFDDGSHGHHNLMKSNLFMSIEKCIDSPVTAEFCLIFQDDAKFHREFWKQAAILLNSLPKRMVAVHLCPGPISPTLPDRPIAQLMAGKRYNGPPIRGRNPDLYKVTESLFRSLHNSTGDSYFLEWPQFGTRRVIAGMPVAFILRRDKAKTLYTRLKSREVWSKKGGADARLTRKFTISDENEVQDCFVARQPLLCYHLIGTSSRTKKAGIVHFDYP